MHIGFIGDSITARIANNGTGNFDTENNAVAITIKELGTGFV
jgi:hypothetical protein